MYALKFIHVDFVEDIMSSYELFAVMRFEYCNDI